MSERILQQAAEVNRLCEHLIAYRDSLSAHDRGHRDLLADVCNALDGYTKALKAQAGRMPNDEPLTATADELADHCLKHSEWNKGAAGIMARAIVDRRAALNQAASDREHLLNIVCSLPDHQTSSSAMAATYWNWLQQMRPAITSARAWKARLAEPSPSLKKAREDGE